MIFLCSLLKWNTTCLLLQNIGFYFCIVFAWFCVFWFSISLMWNSRHILWPMSVFCYFWWETKKNCFWSTFRYVKIKTSAVIFLFVPKYIRHFEWLSFLNRKIESAKIHNELLLNHQQFWSVQWSTHILLIEWST